MLCCCSYCFFPVLISLFLFLLLLLLLLLLRLILLVTSYYIYCCCCYCYCYWLTHVVVPVIVIIHVYLFVITVVVVGVVFATLLGLWNPVNELNNTRCQTTFSNFILGRFITVIVVITIIVAINDSMIAW